MNKQGFVYIMANENLTLYTGVTNNLKKRAWEHKNSVGSVFTKKYSLHKLIYYEYYELISSAIIREKQIKDMNRKNKIEMIKKKNPHYIDLYNSV